MTDQKTPKLKFFFSQENLNSIGTIFAIFLSIISIYFAVMDNLEKFEDVRTEISQSYDNEYSRIWGESDFGYFASLRFDVQIYNSSADNVSISNIKTYYKKKDGNLEFASGNIPLINGDSQLPINLEPKTSKIVYMDVSLPLSLTCSFVEFEDMQMDNQNFVDILNIFKKHNKNFPLCTTADEYYSYPRDFFFNIYDFLTFEVISASGNSYYSNFKDFYSISISDNGNFTYYTQSYSYDPTY